MSTEERIKSDREFLLGLLSYWPTKPSAALISEYVEGRRVMPPNTPFPGIWQNAKTPYMVEIIDNMSPHSAVMHTVLMKGAQEGATAGAENVIGYFMDELPTEILMVSASEDLLGKWATKRLEPLIDSLGIREKIQSTTETKGSRRLADKQFSKQFIGGNLDMASAQSASSLRSDSKRVLIRDEIDGAPPNLRTGEGRWLAVSYARTAAWGNRKKIFDLSTPTTYAESEIWPQYERGDQRKYLVPCPFCETEQELQWWWDRTDVGIRPIYDESGVLIDAVYICPHCGESIRNHQKTRMLARGRWQPTATSSEPGYRSYHISALYSPVGMRSWRDVYQRYLSAIEDPDEMRAFVNLELGLPYRESGTRPRLDKIIELQGGYRRGTVPYGVLFLTMGIDVQWGSSHDPNNPPRIELEILGTGAGYRTWSINYWRIEGDVTDPYSGAWEQLNEYAEETGLQFSRADGQQFSVQIVFVDSNDPKTQVAAEAFCERWRNTFPIRGANELKQRKNESADEYGVANFRRYRLGKIGQGESWYYMISTNYYKQLVYNRLNTISRTPGQVQKPGFCDFPRDYDSRYFEMLRAEERLSDGSFDAGGRRNEALDVRVYAMCAADVYLDNLIMEMRERLRTQGAKRRDADKIGKRDVLALISKRAGVEFPLNASETE